MNLFYQLSRLLLVCSVLFTSKLLAQETFQQQLARESTTVLANAAKAEGNATRGAVLFFQPYLSCAKCHDAEEKLRLGPDLSKTGPETKGEYLVEAILHPSKVIKKGYETTRVITHQGTTISGIVVAQTADQLTLIEPAGNKTTVLKKSDIEEQTTVEQSMMPEGLINALSDRQQFLDLVKYLLEISEHGPSRAKELRPAVTTLVLPEYEKEIDHAGLIRSWNAKSLQRGEAIYSRICANCHGTKESPGSLPTSPRFAAHVFKNGSDPYSLYQTLTRGYNMMAPQTWMVPQQKYDVIHYLRETYLREENPKQYTKLDDSYLAKLPVGKTFGPAPAKVEPWMAMDYGPSLMNTYEINTTKNIAYKGIAMRLDAGSGGVSRGKYWAVFDHDTLNYASAWTGEGFIDWKGIHFNGQHQVHPKISGERLIENPSGPGWADPATGKFTDPRLVGRDERHYGPLPKSWAKYRGLYAYGDQTVIAYRVGDADILELDAVEQFQGQPVFSRTLEIGKSTRDLRLRVAPVSNSVTVIGNQQAKLSNMDEMQVLDIPAAATPTRIKILLSKLPAEQLADFTKQTSAPQALQPLTTGGPKRWPEILKTAPIQSQDHGAFVVDTLTQPDRNPWNALLRLTGFDFLPDQKRIAVCTWDGDVWIISGIDKPGSGLTWQRIASGLFQPLGLKFHAGSIYVCCRDQIVKLHDLNKDGETDFYECFNSDHQVTEHFHEFAMGLQTDTKGNFYYAKSGRHALPALVPHHGTLLKVSPDGQQTEILATGFRAANGVCLNPDGTFFVTDQEGFWTPKNRINKVEVGGFYGNMFGYTDQTDTADTAMKQPLCWITNAFDRSPAELIWVPEKTWGPLAGALLNISYGHGKIYVVPHETVNGQAQGGMCAFPLPTFATGIMRPRFHPTDGNLYVCGMFAWAGNQTAPGGFYRVRPTGKPVDLPLELHAAQQTLTIRFTDKLSEQSATDPANYKIKIWDLKRSEKYGSKHLDEKSLAVTKAKLLPDQQTVQLTIPELEPTKGMEIRYQLTGDNGRSSSGVINNTIHELAK
jgi:putative heme-binding domain-containing protein